MENLFVSSAFLVTNHQIFAQQLHYINQLPTKIIIIIDSVSAKDEQEGGKGKTWLKSSWIARQVIGTIYMRGKIKGMRGLLGDME